MPVMLIMMPVVSSASVMQVMLMMMQVVSSALAVLWK